MSPSDHVEELDSLPSYYKNNAIAALRKIRVVHISDLHFVNHWLLKRFSFEGMRGHDPETVAALQHTVSSLKPDLLIVTGDQSTWGDRASLASAKVFILKLAALCQLGQSSVFWIPGNHDILLHYYLGARFLTRKYDRVFGKLEACRHVAVAGYNVGVFSFDSTLDRSKQMTPLWPVVGSKGHISRSSFNEFNNAAAMPASTSCDFKIGLIHHHPLPIPYKGNHGVGIELTTMTNGGTFVAYMQESDVNLVMHGHEHHPYSCRYSFDPSRQELVLVAAGSAAQREAHENSFNYLEIVPRARVIVRKYTYRETGFRRDSPKVFTF